MRITGVLKMVRIITNVRLPLAPTCWSWLFNTKNIMPTKLACKAEKTVKGLFHLPPMSLLQGKGDFIGWDRTVHIHSQDLSPCKLLNLQFENGNACSWV